MQGQVQQSYEPYHLRAQPVRIRLSHGKAAAGDDRVCVRAHASALVYFKGTAGLVDLLIIFVLQAVMEGNEKEVRKRKKGRQVYTWMLQSIKTKSSICSHREQAIKPHTGPSHSARPWKRKEGGKKEAMWKANRSWRKLFTDLILRLHVSLCRRTWFMLHIRKVFENVCLHIPWLFFKHSCSGLEFPYCICLQICVFHPTLCWRELSDYLLLKSNCYLMKHFLVFPTESKYCLLLFVSYHFLVFWQVLTKHIT